MSFGIIYKAKNTVNDKVYIGQTTEGLNIRIKKHYGGMNYYSKFNRHFPHALRKYNKSDFSWSVLEKCSSKEELDEMEFHYIMQYDSYNNGYNMTLGGEGVIGHKHSPESIKKMSKAKKGKPSPRKGCKASLITRANMSKAAKNRETIPFTKEHCERISKAKMGKKRSDETKRKVSEGLKRYYANKKLLEATS